MRHQTKMRMIKSICWSGVVADAFWTLALVQPKLYAALTGGNDFSHDLSARLIAATAACLMAGWTVLLAWTAQKPIERRAVMAFAAMPVLAGLLCVTLIGHSAEQDKAVWIPVKTAGLLIAMLWAFFSANAMAKKARDENRR